MQAAKIKIGAKYAVKHNDELRVFVPVRVVTTRTGPHASDFEHAIHGHVHGVPNNSETVKYSPDGVLGPYEEYQQLVAEQAAREAASKAADSQRRQAAADLQAALCRLLDIPVPTESAYRDPIRISYGGGVDIDAKGVALLLAELKNRSLA